MKRLVVATLVSLAALFASSCATSATQQDDGGLSDAQRLEQHDDYVPWWKLDF